MLFLESLPQGPLHSIEAIQICPKDVTFKKISDTKYRSNFRALDESLNAPNSKFAALKYFTYYTEDSMEDSTEIVQTAFREMMPKSYERGILWWGDIDAEDVVGEQTGSSRWGILYRLPSQFFVYHRMSKRVSHYITSPWCAMLISEYDFSYLSVKRGACYGCSHVLCAIATPSLLRTDTRLSSHQVEFHQDCCCVVA